MLIHRIAKAIKDGIQGKSFNLRSDKWPEVEKAHLEKEPVCQ